MWYQSWSEPLYYSDQATNVSALRAIPMITWDPAANGVGIPLAQIVAGKYEGYIKSAAAAALAWGKPMYIRFAHEMNLSNSPFGPGADGNTPAEFVAAWRHVVSIFRQQGATNVEWVWSPNVDCSGKCLFTAFYPGDAWVDWVALDGYNYSTVDGDPWMTFDQTFGPSYEILTQLTSKPVMIGETASTELGGGKAQWITQTFSTLPAKYPHIHAVIWFDRDKETDWEVNSSAASLAAWQHVVASPLYAGSPLTLLGLAPLASDISGLSAPASSVVSTKTNTSTSSVTRRKTKARHVRHHHRIQRHQTKRRKPARRSTHAT